MSLAAINKDLSRDAAITIVGPSALIQAQAMRLTAPSLSAKEDITLGGAGVDKNGFWRGGHHESVELQDGKARLGVPAGSAALITLTSGAE